MPPTWLIFAVLGPMFLLLAIGRTVQAGRWVPQARVWTLVGLIFSAVALWLHGGSPHP